MSSVRIAGVPSSNTPSPLMRTAPMSSPTRMTTRNSEPVQVTSGS